MPRPSQSFPKVCPVCEQHFLGREFQQFCKRPCYLSARRQPIEERFWSYFDKTSSPDGCWLWTGKLQKPHGYGIFTYTDYTSEPPKPMQERAHRFAFKLLHGAIPEGLSILH